MISVVAVKVLEAALYFSGGLEKRIVLMEQHFNLK